MRWIVTALVMGSVLAGCSTHTAQMDSGGYASPPSDRLDIVRQTSDAEAHPGKTRSVHDFAIPRGLYQ